MTRVSMPVPTGHQVEKNAKSPSAMLRRINRPRVHRPDRSSSYSAASRSANSQKPQSSSLALFVPPPAERRRQAEEARPCAISSAAPATGGLDRKSTRLNSSHLG